jgi:tRNA A-37 threonylcarbamoyl transferase component Bud32
MGATSSIVWHPASDAVGRARLRELLERGSSQVVKKAPHRGVRRVTLGGLDVHVKHYGEGVGRCLLGPRARREYEITREVARRGVATLEALAWGEDAGGSYLVTRTLPDASLLDVLASPLTARLRQQIAKALGTFLARAHRAGVRHDDLHPGNLLMRHEQGRIDFYLIDLHAVRLLPPLGWPAARDNLVVLNRWFFLRSSRADRLRFWFAYSREAAVADVVYGARELERLTRRSITRFVAGLDRRCLGGNRHYRRDRTAGAVGHAVAGIDAVALMQRADGLLDSPSTRTLKRSASSAVVETTADVDGQAKTVILKRVNATRWTDPLAALFRPPPALHAYLMGCALRLRGIPTARPLAVWHRKRWGLFTDGYLIQEKIPGSVYLGGFVNRMAVDPLGAHRLRDVAAQVGRLVARLHAWNFSHRDLKSPNVLVSPMAYSMGQRGLCEAGEDGGDHVWLVDLAGVRRMRRLDDWRKARDLARLNASFVNQPGASRSLRLRLLLAYLGRDGGKWKVWWRRIEAMTESKVELNRSRGRVLG